MAPPRKIPAIDTNPGHKVTTVRMPNAEFEEYDLFANALGISMNEFLRKAAKQYAKSLAQDPEVRKSVQKQINRVQAMMDRIAKRTFDISDDEDEDDEDIEEIDEDDDDE